MSAWRQLGSLARPDSVAVSQAGRPRGTHTLVWGDWPRRWPRVIRKMILAGPGAAGSQAWGPSRAARSHFGNCALERRELHQSHPHKHTALQSGTDVQTSIHRNTCWVVCAPLLKNKQCILDYLSACRTQWEKDRESIHSKPLPYQCLIRSNSVTWNPLKGSTNELPYGNLRVRRRSFKFCVTGKRPFSS